VSKEVWGSLAQGTNVYHGFGLNYGLGKGANPQQSTDNPVTALNKIPSITEERKKQRQANSPRQNRRGNEVKDPVASYFLFAVKSNK